MALDMGTSALHCLLSDSLGRPIDSADASTCYFTPEGGPPLAREFDPESVCASFQQLIARVLHRQGIGPERIFAIGLTSQRQGVVFLDEQGRELYCGPNVDLRAVFEGAALDEEYGRRVYATTGHPSSLLLTPARLLWFREHQPLIYESTHTILTVSSWLAYKLTGELTSEPCLEGEAGLLDVGSRERCPALTDDLGVPAQLLAPLSPPGVPAGQLGRSTAKLWGLSSGVPVVIAGPDTQCGLLGMGLTKEGQAGAVIGWSAALQVLTPQPCHDGEEMRTWAGCYPLDGLWVAESNLGVAGHAYRWLKDTLLDRQASFEEAEELALSAAPAPDGAVAFLGPGPENSFKAGLRMGGLLFPTPVSFQETTKGQMFRAALENIAFSVKANLATLVEVAGIDQPEIHLGGGMARSRALAAILAAALGRVIHRSLTPQVSARGAAMAAAAATEPSLTVQQIAQKAARDLEEVEPGTASEIAQYEEHYNRWLGLYQRLGWE